MNPLISGKTILILGAGEMQLPGFYIAKKLNLKIISVDPTPHSIGFEFSDKFYVYDLADEENCIQIAKKHNIDGVFTLAADYPVPMVAKICEALGLPGLSVDAAELATNKSKMRKAFEFNHVPSPISISAATLDDTFKALKQINSVSIIKPNLSNGGRGITQLKKTPNDQDIKVAFDNAMTHTRSGGILIEEFVDGPEFSVETITFNGVTHVINVTDKLTQGPPHFVEIGHNQPTMCLKKDIDKIKKTAINGINALGINNSAGHAEIKLTQQGTKVIEIGARLGGGLITTHLVPLSTGINMVKAVIMVALGVQPDTKSNINKGAAVLFFTPPPGKIKNFTGLEEAKKLTGIEEIKIYIKPGETIKPLKDSTGRVGHIVSKANDVSTAIQIAEKARQHILFNFE